MTTWVLILVIVHPWGSTGLTSQSVEGYTERATCAAAASDAVKQKHALSAFCVERR
jgi:hypothetical protein